MKPGMVSGIIQTKFGFHLIFVEGHQAPGTEPFDSVKSSIREFLMTQKATDVVLAVTVGVVVLIVAIATLTTLPGPP